MRSATARFELSRAVGKGGVVNDFLLGIFCAGVICIEDSLDLHLLKERVKRIFYHSYDNYLQHAYPYDELRPLTCDGQDTWGSFSLTLVDSLDTLVVLGNYTEFRRAVELLLKNLDPNKNVNVSVFETNIRVVGGLLSAHLLAKKAGMDTEPGWPCHGRLLDLAERFASRILPAFNTPSGMPYGTVNLALGGVPLHETPVTCVATIGTCILEFGALSRLTGDLRYEKAALRALRALWAHRSHLGLIGNHINVLTGEWVGSEATIGAGVDSYFEYLLKGAIMFRMPELDAMFRDYRQIIRKHMKFGSWHYMVSMKQGSVTSPLFQSLESFWPGVLALAGDIEEAKESLLQYHQVWKKYGFLPEMYDINSGKPVSGRAAYPLRPEFIESVLHLYRATRDPYLLEVGVDVLTSIESQARTGCGYATVADVRTHALEDRMESFFLAETTKYLYLLFDTDNFLHTLPSEERDQSLHSVSPSPAWASSEQQCEPESGGYIFNTEAHPLDSGLIHCCSIQRVQSLDATAHLTAQLPELDLNLTTLGDAGVVDDRDDNFPDNPDGREEPLPGPAAGRKVLEAKLVEEVDKTFVKLLTPGLKWDGSSFAVPRGEYRSVNTMAVEVGSDEWLTSLWQDLSGLLMLLPSEEKYPPGYVPALMRRSPPLMTCPNIPFSVHLKSFQDLDTLDLR
nr:unnamed protein product [Spirometra erinaceieuropaei]